MGFFDRINEGLTKSRIAIKEQLNILLDNGPDLDENFWEGLEETLILSDMGAKNAYEICENLRDYSIRNALPDSYSVIDRLAKVLSEMFVQSEKDIFNDASATIIFVGINGNGKTTTIGKVAHELSKSGKRVIIGACDTFRAAAIEQLELWAARSNTPIVAKERKSDPASVAFSTIEEAEKTNADIVLLDTAGRLHTSADLMRELVKIVNVVKNRSKMDVYTVLVIDACTGQNGLNQAIEFNKCLDLDGIILSKLDGSAKGGIALSISRELNLPIVKIGIGEGLDDLKDFDALDFSKALIGDFTS